MGAAVTAIARSAGCRRGNRGRDHHRRICIDFEDAEAQHAVGDLQIVVELVKQLGRRLEAQPTVVGLVPPADFIGHLAQTPFVLVLERAFVLDPAAHFLRKRVSPGLVWAGVKHQNQLVFAGSCQNGEGLKRQWAERRVPLPAQLFRWRVKLLAPRGIAEKVQAAGRGTRRSPQCGANSIEPSLGGGETGGSGGGAGTTFGTGTELWVGGSGEGSGMGDGRGGIGAAAFCWCRWAGMLCSCLALRREMSASDRGL